MNAMYHTIWNVRSGFFAAVSEHTRGTGKAGSSSSGGGHRIALRIMAVSVALACASGLHAQPTGGVVSAGSADIVVGGGVTTINQSSANLVIDWQSFSIGAGQSVRFVQPGSASVALNRVLGSDASTILGQLSSNGKVFLVNPNGIMFGQGASVNVGALVASTRDITNADFMTGKYQFSGAASGAVSNEGAIHAADGGYVALLGAKVSNQGRIEANFGTVVLAAGNAMTMALSADRLLSVSVDQGTVNALVENGGLIQADGGRVLLTTQAAGNLLQSSVNNTGVIRAQTLEEHGGVIRLMGDMQSGTVHVGGTLDASAPNGGNGGAIETSAAHVQVGNDAKVATNAARGLGGNWLIDPQDFTIGSSVGDNISGTTLAALLVTNSVTISTMSGTNTDVAGVPGTSPPVSNRYATTAGNGDIFVKDAISWTASSNTTTLTLNAERDINITKAISATNGNLQACCGRDINVTAAITTVSGSVLLGAGRDLNLNVNVNLNSNAHEALTTTNGNLMLCAANNVNIGGAITLTGGAKTVAQSLNLSSGLLISAGNSGTGSGTVIFNASAPRAAITDSTAPVRIIYNPISYSTPTDYSSNFTLTTGATLTQQMLVFAGGGDKTADGTTATTLKSLKGAPPNVTLVQGAGSSANFDDPNVGVGKTITFTGYSLGGTAAKNFALPVACCGPMSGVARTTGAILAAVVISPPTGTTPPLVVPPATGVTPPSAGVTPPAGTTPPVDVLPPVVIPPPVDVPPPVVTPPPVDVPPPVVIPPPVDVPPPVVIPPPGSVLPPVEIPPPVGVPPPVDIPLPVGVPPPVDIPLPVGVPPPVDIPPPVDVPPPVVIPLSVDVPQSVVMPLLEGVPPSFVRSTFVAIPGLAVTMPLLLASPVLVMPLADVSRTSMMPAPLNVPSVLMPLQAAEESLPDTVVPPHGPRKRYRY